MLLSWCKILRVHKLQQILVVVLNGVTDENYIQLKDTQPFQEWKQFFTSVREYYRQSENEKIILYSNKFKSKENCYF